MATLPIAPFLVSVAESRGVLGKRFALTHDGNLHKSAAVTLTDGSATEHICADLAGLKALRDGLSERQALLYGTTGHASAQVVTQDSLEIQKVGGGVGPGLPVVARDGKHFRWPDGPGVLFIDHDPAAGEVAMSAAELRAALVEAEPGLHAVSMLVVPSAGSCIYAEGQELIGVRGLHAYLVIDDARQIPRIGASLFSKLVLSGFGRIAVSGAGTMLERACIDGTVWQPERLDFVRATCASGLVQHFPRANLFGPADQTMLVADSVSDLTPAERDRLGDVWRDLRHSGAARAADVREMWAKARAEADARKLSDAPSSEWVTERTARYASSAARAHLEKHHELKLSTGERVTVAELLASPQKYDGARMHDPFEPEYGGSDRRIAVARLKRDRGQDPVIFSHAHGGTLYSLLDADDVFAGLDDEATAAAMPPPLQATQGERRPTEQRGERRGKFTVVPAAEFASGPAPRWHIPGVLPRAELTVLFGPSGSGKSFVALDIAASIASGEEWRGHRTEAGRVVYIVGEGKAGFRKRLDALQRHRGIDLVDLRLDIVAECPRILDGDELALGEAIAAGGGADLIIVDTLAQVMSGADENSATDMGAALNALKRLHEATGATVLLVHHSGKDEARGARGWSGLRAAADAELEVSRRTGSRMIRVTKQKDGDDYSEFAFELVPITLGTDDEGEPITSCTVRHIDRPPVVPANGETARPRGRVQQAIWDAATAAGVKTREAVIDSAVAAIPGPPTGGRDTRRARVLRALQDLVSGQWLSDGPEGVCALV